MNSILQTLSQWNVIVGLIFVIIAFVVMGMSSFFAKKIVKDDENEEEILKYTIRFKLIAGGLALIACVLVVFLEM